MNLTLDLRTTLTQTLTPQQIQYLKLLQLPLMQLEQQIRQEIEQNPMLEEVTPEESYAYDEDEYGEPTYTEESHPVDKSDEYYEDIAESEPEHRQLIDDRSDPFEFFKLIWQDDETYNRRQSGVAEDEEAEPFQIKQHSSIFDELLSQFRLSELSEEEIILGEQIIGNIDGDGYLRRDLSEIVNDTNVIIEEKNQELLKQTKPSKTTSEDLLKVNPARQYAIPDSILEMVNLKEALKKDSKEQIEKNKQIDETLLKPVDIHTAEKVLKIIQDIEPYGIGSRTLQECLLAQIRAIPQPNATQTLAYEILDKAFNAFEMKHYNILKRQFSISEGKLKEALDFIKKLNPKPGGGEPETAIMSIIPDFIVEKDKESDDLIITVNESNIPAIRLSKAYDKLRREARFKHFNKDTKEWLRAKYEDAKFLIKAIRQRKNTMLKVMTSIVAKQKDFFEKGPAYLKPIVYKDIANDIGFDIATICRIVNGKYVQTEFGIYELKYFFSESLTTDDGVEVSTTVIKQIIKEIIDQEPKNKPLSDDKISEELKNRGYQVARRTVAKYREMMKIPVARLRKEL